MESSLVYTIHIKGELDPCWSTWFEGLTVVTADNGETSITGTVVDQAELHGLLNKIRDLGLPLISVMKLASECSLPLKHETK